MQVHVWEELFVELLTKKEMIDETAQEALRDEFLEEISEEKPNRFNRMSLFYEVVFIIFSSLEKEDKAYAA